jgi:hypothetical protein
VYVKIPCCASWATKVYFLFESPMAELKAFGEIPCDLGGSLIWIQEGGKKG